MKIIHIILSSILILSVIGFGLTPIVYAERYEKGDVLPSIAELQQAEGLRFGAGIDLGNESITFPAGTFFESGREFTGDTVHQFTGNGLIFGDGSGIVFSMGMGTTFGANADFSGGLVTDGADAGKIVETNTYGQGTLFPNGQTFVNPQNFAKYNHFGDNTDFTDASQTFKEGMAFGPGSIFQTSQVLPVGTIPSQGVIMSAFTCPDTACVPDPDNVIAPGEKFASGIDPAATFDIVRSDSKTLEIDGLGLTMIFDDVSTDGTIKADLKDPATVPNTTLDGDTLTMTMVDGTEKQSIGNVIELSADTASISGHITVTLPYQQSEVPDGIDESTLRILHYVNSNWNEEESCTVDTDANTVTCDVSSLSPFAVGGGNSNSGSGGGGGNCDSKGIWGTNNSLRVYQVSHNIESLQVTVNAYSTCGPISAIMKTSDQQSMLKLLTEQPLLDQNIVVYSGYLDPSDKKFRIIVENNHRSFDKIFYIHDKSIISKYSGTTGYTSEQQGTPLQNDNLLDPEPLPVEPEPLPVEPEQLPADPEPVEPEQLPADPEPFESEPPELEPPEPTASSDNSNSVWNIFNNVFSYNIK